MRRRRSKSKSVGNSTPTDLPAPPDWLLCGYTLKPSPHYVNRFNTWLSQQDYDDLVVRFIFLPSFSAAPISIHQSRLIWAGGPLRALTERDFVEHARREVSLSAFDDPDTFALLRDYLYGRNVVFQDPSLELKLKVIRASHRWELINLFQKMCELVVQVKHLNNADEILQTIDVVSLPDIPEFFRGYFWDAVGRCFDEFSLPQHHVTQQEGIQGTMEKLALSGTAKQQLSVETKLCPRFPDLWPMAVSQNMIHRTFQGILRCTRNRETVVKGLLDLVLCYLEPRMSSDCQVCNLFAELMRHGGLSTWHYGQVLQRPNLDDECSTRAVRLLAKCLQEPRVARQETRYAWRWSLGSCDKLVREVVFKPECMTKLLTSSLSNTQSNSFSTPPQNFAFVTQPNKLIAGKLFGEQDEEVVRNSMRFILMTDKDTNGNVEIRVSWAPGSGLSTIYQRVGVMLEVLDNDCACMGGSAEYDGRGGCLKREECEVQVKDRGGVTIRLAEMMLKKYRASHNNANLCGVNLVLTIRELEL